MSQSKPPGISVGTIIHVEEPDYRYGTGTLVLQTTAIGSARRQSDGLWLKLRGHQIRWNGETDVRERYALVRLEAVRIGSSDENRGRTPDARASMYTMPEGPDHRGRQHDRAEDQLRARAEQALAAAGRTGQPVTVAGPGQHRRRVRVLALPNPTCSPRSGTCNSATPRSSEPARSRPP